MVYEDKYEDINDLSTTGFENTTDKGLIQGANTHAIERDRIKLEMNRRLKKSIGKFNVKSTNQSNRMFWLTVAIFFLGIIQLGVFLYSLLSK